VNRPIRIGLIAEGEAELGPSIPYIKPEDGGKLIDRDAEGALHTLIRRELEGFGLPDCQFVQRHPSSRESRVLKRRVGHSILECKYLAQVVSVWKPEEVDMIVIVVDADDVLAQRQRGLELALNTIRDNHLDVNEQTVCDRSAGGLAIKNFDTWLLADTQTVSEILDVRLEPPKNLEDLNDAKDVLESAIANSTYLCEDTTNQRPLKIKWRLAFKIDLKVLKTLCPNGYAVFAEGLSSAAKAVASAHRSIPPQNPRPD
jgi:hypothetical protein